MSNSHFDGDPGRWSRRADDGETLGHAVGMMGRILAAGWSAVWMGVACVLLGVLVGFVALRSEAMKSLRPPGGALEESLATLRQALERAEARAEAAEALSRRAQLAAERADQERLHGTAECTADRRELGLLRERLAAAEARERAPVAPAAVSAMSSVAGAATAGSPREACEQQVSAARGAWESEMVQARADCARQLGVARAAQAQAEGELRSTQTQCAVLLMQRGARAPGATLPGWPAVPMIWMAPTAAPAESAVEE
jgi:hypothetical protein